MKRLPSLLLCLVATTSAACGDNLTFPPEREAATSEDPSELACTPDIDGVLRRDELAAAIGVPIGYLVSPPGTERPVDLRGTPDDDGKTHWDFSIDYADDRALEITPRTPAGAWYEAEFAEEGAFVTPLDAGGRIESIGVLRDDGLYLLGVASAEADPPEGRTLLVYQDAILILALPIVLGNEHVAVGTIEDGLAQGLPYAGRDVYAVNVDALGSIDLPQLSFDQVHRVVTQVTVEPVVGSSVTRRQVSFYAECFAEVARASADGEEDDVLFGTASELRRLGF
jgi:hypothetical protein